MCIGVNPFARPTFVRAKKTRRVSGKTNYFIIVSAHRDGRCECGRKHFFSGARFDRRANVHLVPRDVAADTPNVHRVVELVTLDLAKRPTGVHDDALGGLARHAELVGHLRQPRTGHRRTFHGLGHSSW